MRSLGITLFICLFSFNVWCQNSEYGAGVHYAIGTAHSANMNENTYNGVGLSSFWWKFVDPRIGVGLSSGIDLFGPDQKNQSDDTFLPYTNVSGQINVRFNLFPAYNEKKFGSPFIGVGTGISYFFFSKLDGQANFTGTLIGDRNRFSLFVAPHFGLNIHRYIQIRLIYTTSIRAPKDGFDQFPTGVVESGFSDQRLNYVSFGLYFRLTNQD